jgi:hypothetical protein
MPPSCSHLQHATPRFLAPTVRKTHHNVELYLDWYYRTFRD